MSGNRLIIIAFIAYLVSFISCDYNTYNQGKYMYNRFCASCHMENGEGLKSLIPPVKNSDYIRNNQDKMACIIRHGISDTIIVNGIEYNEPMEGFKSLKDNEIANIINYVNKYFNDIDVFYSPDKVNNTLKNCSNN